VPVRVYDPQRTPAMTNCGKGSGMSLIRELQREGIRAIEVEPEGDKNATREHPCRSGRFGVFVGRAKLRGFRQLPGGFAC
jgi:hypothetical protein